MQAQRDALLKAAKDAVALLEGMWASETKDVPAYITGRAVAKLEAAIALSEQERD